METIERLIEQEQGSTAQRELSGEIEEIRRDVGSLRRRLDQLAKLETLLKAKYQNKLKDLFAQFNKAEGYQGELQSLANQLKKNKEKQSNFKKQIAELKRHKKTIREAIKQVEGYEKSSSEQIEIIEEEHEVLCQRVQDLMQMLELAEQAELSGKELEIVCQRVCASKNLLEEHEKDLRKRIIDLVFECYIPPKNKSLGW